MDVPALFGRFLLAPPALAAAVGRPENPSPPGTLPKPSALPSRAGHEPGQASGPLFVFP